MKPASKYLFDDDFAGGAKPKSITMVEFERRQADAASQAHRKGFEAGQAQARTEINEKISKTMTRIADDMDRLHRGLAAIEARLEAEAVQVAIAVAAKLAPDLIAREPFTEISALATEAFRQLVATPQIAVHIGADIYESGKEKLEEIARTRGFEGRLTVLADDTMQPGDCRIEWADGGINRDSAATVAAIEEMVRRYVTARTAPLI
jgi:flagellar assembly protein FliH